MKEIRYSTADEAVKAVKSHDHIHLSSVASVPHCLIDALVRRADRGEIRDVRFHHFHTEGPAPYSNPEYTGIFFDQGFFIGPNVRADVNAGYADYLPVHLGESQKLYRAGILPCDVAMVQVSLPDENGFVSLGTSVDASVGAVEVAKTAIAVVNPHVPFSYGDLIPLERFDYVVKDDTPLITKDFAEPTPTEVLIGKNCAELVPDGACIQMGIGALPNALAGQLRNHRNLGLHTEMFADGLLRLIKAGVINGSCKKIDTGKVVASFLLGSQEVYDFIDHNPMVQMRDIKYTNDPWVIAQNPNMMAINSATEVDLTGQISADSIGTRIFSGTGGQLEFVKGATMSEGGKSVTAFASRTKNGKTKIVPILNPGAGVVTPRADAHWIVTEYGAVDLTGKSLQERAKLLISIAHPDDREALDRAAFGRFGPNYRNLSI
ncbi:MAG: acetyl-CoA hydrolase/transferase family protein [Bacteroidales bacterium]|nr:acetyl-CoA hydrolase/transferase family protein [Bacteroidales bacterium]MBQ4305878.1 acetyl-CoA hydrolase/transferase family protein [Bacteroidales bacterium]